MDEELDHDELAATLAQHRTDNAEEGDLRRMYYDVVKCSFLDDFTAEEIAEMIDIEIGADDE